MSFKQTGTDRKGQPTRDRTFEASRIFPVNRSCTDRNWRNLLSHSHPDLPTSEGQVRAIAASTGSS
jgi:hypothetical protein